MKMKECLEFFKKLPNVAISAPEVGESLYSDDTFTTQVRITFTNGYTDYSLFVEAEVNSNEVLNLGIEC